MGPVRSELRCEMLLLIEQAAHRLRHRDFALVEIRLVVFLDLWQVVEVVHHDASRLLTALRGEIRTAVDPMQLRTVAKMEAGYRIAGQVAGRAAGSARTV